MDNPSDSVWLTLIGIGEDGAAGLGAASQQALGQAHVIIGPPRHLALLPTTLNPAAERIVWPKPFASGLQRLLALRGRRVAMLVSGDPFWYGAGRVIARTLPAHEWRALPAPSAFSVAAARLGWALEEVLCLGLHAAPLEHLRPRLAPGVRALVLVRDGAAVGELAAWLGAQGFGASVLHVLEALGGPRERIRRTTAADYALTDVVHPVTVGIEAAADASALVVPCASGLADDWFEHDGQLTKRPIRAMTLSALAPRPGELLWDIGTGSGSIAIEWLLAHPANRAVAFESNPERAERAERNARRLGVERLQIVVGHAPAVLEAQPTPDAVFIGGGLSEALLAYLWTRLRPGTRLVANAVALESQALLMNWHALHGGELLRLEWAEAAPLGGRRGWRPAYPLVQWSVCR